MTLEQALQVLSEATANLPATRAQHAQIVQALTLLQGLVNQTKVQLAAVTSEKKTNNP